MLTCPYRTRPVKRPLKVSMASNLKTYCCPHCKKRSRLGKGAQLGGVLVAILVINSGAQLLVGLGLSPIYFVICLSLLFAALMFVAAAIINATGTMERLPQNRMWD